MSPSKLNILLLSIFTFLLGVLVNDVPRITFKSELSLGDISNIILALFIAYYIQHYLGRKTNNKRVEKDILIQKCNRLNDELDELTKTIGNLYTKHQIIKKDLKTEIKINVRKISNRLNSLSKNMSSYKNKNEINNIIKDLISNQFKLWANLTDNIMDKKAKISHNIYSRYESNVHEYSDNIFKLIMYINDI